jgi:hypothetical protein
VKTSVTIDGTHDARKGEQMPPKTEVAKTATFTTDDKRAQYARLVVFNHGVKAKVVAKGKDVNSVSAGDMQKAFKDLAGGNLLDGKDGIALIQSLSKNGSTTGRELTTAYAQEVRPFIRRGHLAPTFGRRGKKAAEKPAASGKAGKGAKASKAAEAGEAGAGDGDASGGTPSE